MAHLPLEGVGEVLRLQLQEGVVVVEECDQRHIHLRERCRLQLMADPCVKATHESEEKYVRNLAQHVKSKDKGLHRQV